MYDNERYRMYYMYFLSLRNIEQNRISKVVPIVDSNPFANENPNDVIDEDEERHLLNAYELFNTVNSKNILSSLSLISSVPLVKGKFIRKI